ncbi:hypothetical protein E2C01_064961 [Portunus trituberculatus]|uniref:Uncharacterized protein n=1 Tax=Portunus trituberculatus TaxID=210409 RepID=A0A5B7HNC9_PORTR|nr:hypothetical protein [Portunus trituberculatus]
MSEGGGSSAAPHGGKMRLSPCLMPWFASLVWVQLGCVCCITAMMFIFFMLLYWAIPRDEDSPRPLTLSHDADQASSVGPWVKEQIPNLDAKPVSSNVKHPQDAAAPVKSSSPPTRISHKSSNSHLHHLILPPNPLPSTTTHALLSTTITTSHVPPSTTITGSHNRFTTSSSTPSLLNMTSRPGTNSIADSQKILPFHTDTRGPLPLSISQSTGVSADENDNSETAFSGRSSSGTRHFSLSSASPEGRPSSSLVDLKSHIREMLSKVREIDTRFVRRDEVVVRRVVREDAIVEKQEEEVP